ncbi:MAG: hypothetical protein Q4E05_10920 [Pseudoclavibacter sp.]|nr:hypothetical protein [Pseudoclavibacter sp.]
MKEDPQRYAISAVWFDPAKPTERYAKSLVSVLADLAESDPELAAAGWAFGSHKITTQKSLSSLIRTKKVTGAFYPDGSPILSQGFMVSSYSSEGNYPNHKRLGSLRLSRGADMPNQQVVDFILHHITSSTAVALVRSIARHLQPDAIIGERREFGDAIHQARTVNIRATQLVSQISWIRGLSPEAVAGYPVTDVEEYAGGLFFLARSEQDATALAALNDQLERDHTRRRLGLLPQFYDRDEV